jgi:hypothetical protein
MSVMSTSKHIQIFKPGKHVCSSGATLSFSDVDLAATAAAYDPAKHEAPLVVGHPRTDDPAFGWVGKLAFSDGALDVEPQQVNADFAEMVNSGAFKKISAAFYAPDSPSNPVPGVYYLRHVGFLGAQPPAVKGMRAPQFSDAEDGVVEFSEWGDVQNASLWRRLRDWMIGEKGLDIADNIIPDYIVGSLEQESRSDPQIATSPQYHEPQLKGDEMSAEEKARLAALEAENAKLKQDAASFAEAQAKTQRASLHAAHTEFAEGLIKAGKMLPAMKDPSIALMDSLAAQESPVEFGEGAGKQSIAPLALYKSQLEAMPKQVEFSELAGGNPAKDGVDAEDASALASRAVEFVEAEAKSGRTVSVTEAVNHVLKGSK